MIEDIPDKLYITWYKCLVIHLEYRNIFDLWHYCRYPLDIPSLPWEWLILQDLTHCDYFRTSVVFQALDIYNIVGGIKGVTPA